MVIILFYFILTLHQIDTFNNNLNDEELTCELLCELHYKTSFFTFKTSF